MTSFGIFLRVGKTEAIERQLNEGNLRFGCPANWIDYARKDTSGIADRYEAIYAHVKRDDPRPAELGGGDPINRALEYWFDEGPNDTVYVRDLNSCLVPTICFYSIDVRDAAQHFGIKGNSPMYLDADLRSYYKAMINDPKKYSEYSILVIRFPGHLIDELKHEIQRWLAKR